MHYQRWRRTGDPLKIRKSDGGKLTEDQLTASLLARFCAGVDKSAGAEACWPWTKGCTGQGYGVISRGRPPGNNRLAHRLALEIATGEAGGTRLALHSCDNPPCCNPAHLRWGTQADNVADAFKRGRR